jgi:hypothetical protein
MTVFSVINVTWTGLRKNPGFRRDRPIINPLRQGMAHYINTMQLNRWRLRVGDVKQQSLRLHIVGGIMNWLERWWNRTDR